MAFVRDTVRKTLVIGEKMGLDLNNRTTFKISVKNDYKLARKNYIFDLVSLLLNCLLI